MLSNNGLCLRARSCAVRVTIFSNESIIPPGFKFTKLHALTLAAHSYAPLHVPMRPPLTDRSFVLQRFKSNVLTRSKMTDRVRFSFYMKLPLVHVVPTLKRLSLPHARCCGSVFAHSDAKQTICTIRAKYWIYYLYSEYKHEYTRSINMDILC